ncbi:ribonuclease catalytic domain-containing protein [Francisella philomiragia]|uniref:ribonuclease catalytic domain-containing protein n=1 Tax=Francisella philomiragia TaxID=28110 RepID=UPI001902E019|nr:RNB domain-containing ribonuclease [Francisella philomiragia]MBK2267065.1 RNB domain-containing ribonuclease [Francisella philomiragia]MBK2278436.1 RNB domain-containing ribonuclease [Francisella philomiragia]MBK2286374.1 RNB domain-containing ribonuclease [Francisella philomiragia]MBK2288267.1 RNB domain-containing ribonuclease [Francisella philomiragia]MBK2291187.1 RNB domain-containing ribonuclease [Francisella philomiragia]
MLLENQSIKNALVIFKSKPAKVVEILDKKIEIETLDSKNIKLPAKNVQILTVVENDFDLDKLEKLEIPELELTWELLQEQQQTSIDELSELLFESVGANQAYTVWLLASDGEYFSFNDDFSINIHSQEQKNQIVSDKQEKLRKEQELNDFIERLNNKTFNVEDTKFLKEIEALATLKSTKCRFFKYLNMEESENSAYKLLLDIGYWDEFFNPHLYRYGAELESNPAEFKYNSGSDSQRVDLTHLTAYAIDDEGSNDPDDAISWDAQQNKMWVHIADPSSSINFGDEVDLEARARGSNLYVPEHIITMLPPQATQKLGLGLQEVSPALSVGFRLDESGDIHDIEICFSNIKVTRYSYEFVEENISALELGDIEVYAKYFTDKRLAKGAVELDFPEIKISLDNDKNVKLTDLPRLNSRTLVRDTMLMAGVAIGQFCKENNICVPFSTQPEHDLEQDDLENIDSIADMFATRKKLQRGKYSTEPDVHAGMGLDSYVQVTSPLRRYLDLLVHYQLRNFLENKQMISVDDVDNIIAQVDIPIKSNRQTERFSNSHWKLVYLMQNPNLEFQAAVIEKLDKGRLMVSIADLAMTKKLAVSGKYDLNDQIKLQNTSVNLVTQEAFFKVIEEN